MNSNTETWTSKVAGKTSSQGSRPEMSSDAVFGSSRHEQGHHATPMRHAGSHTESKYQVAGRVFGGRPKMMGREQPSKDLLASKRLKFSCKGWNGVWSNPMSFILPFYVFALSGKQSVPTRTPPVIFINP